jgi:hypothetical protein
MSLFIDYYFVFFMAFVGLACVQQSSAAAAARGAHILAGGLSTMYYQLGFSFLFFAVL